MDVQSVSAGTIMSQINTNGRREKKIANPREGSYHFSEATEKIDVSYNIISHLNHPKTKGQNT